MKRGILAGIIFFIGSLSIAYAQEGDDLDSLIKVVLAEDSIMLNELEALMAQDSLTIFDLVDSLLGIDIKLGKRSQLSLKTGYTSNIVNAGRNFGFDQHGVGGGLAFYHKSGAFADVSGYWSSNTDPNYNTTAATLGYIGTWGKHFSYMTSYAHYFYNKPKDDDLTYYYPITDVASLAAYYEIKKFNVSVDYSFLFGEETAHRIKASLTYEFSWSDLGAIDRLAVLPAISVLAGSQKLYYLNVSYSPEFSYYQMGQTVQQALEQLVIDAIGEKYYDYLTNNNPTKLRRIKTYILNENEDYLRSVAEDYAEEFTIYDESTESVFGVMNYSLAVPVYMYFNNFSVSLLYQYNVPVALPGEQIDLSPNSYFGVGLIYSIPFKK